MPAFHGPQPSGPNAPDANLRRVVDGMHEGVVVRDARGVIVYANAAAERVLRRTRDELVGKTTVTAR
ncbi:MAG: fold, partial [Gaiellales bacterium]|nr:fold [Gaiellales bacterium]